VLSAIIIVSDGRVPVSPSPEAVVRTLSALVPAAIEGLVRDVVLAAPSGNADLARIADHAGCQLAEAGGAADVISAGLRMARGDALLVLRAGHAPERGFFEELADLNDRLGLLGSARVRAMPERFLTRLLPGLAPSVGLVALRRNLPAQAPHLEALISAARPRETMRLRFRRVG
jgi:hypothetical protein